MEEKNADELEKALQSTHIKDFGSYCRENTENPADLPFSAYMKNIFSEKNLTQQLIFLRADIPERYGYKLLSGEKRTRQRDIIDVNEILEKHRMETLRTSGLQD